jgi:hypothetical protein
MNRSGRSRILLPLISLAFAFSAHAEEPNHPGPGGQRGAVPHAPGGAVPHAPAVGGAQVRPAPVARPAGQVARPAAPMGQGARPEMPMHAQGGHPAAVGGGHVVGGPGRMTGAHGPDMRFARGAIVQHDFGGHPYRGRMAWQGGRWHHAVHNGRDGWWWDVGGVWYYYPQQFDGPPAYVSDDYADDVVYDDAPPVAAVGYPAPPPDVPPPPPDPAASAVGGAIVGGVLGGLLTGRASGAAAGAVIGGATGAIAGATAASRPGYYLAQGSCYYRYPSGNYVQADPRWCY